jgi:hypothetical protein
MVACTCNPSYERALRSVPSDSMRPYLKNKLKQKWPKVMDLVARHFHKALSSNPILPKNYI